ncbi:hypothetical protein ACR3K2_06680 [Cryptosporidium serpentis]
MEYNEIDQNYIREESSLKITVDELINVPKNYQDMSKNIIESYIQYRKSNNNGNFNIEYQNDINTKKRKTACEREAIFNKLMEINPTLVKIDSNSIPGTCVFCQICQVRIILNPAYYLNNWRTHMSGKLHRALSKAVGSPHFIDELNDFSINESHNYIYNNKSNINNNGELILSESPSCISTALQSINNSPLAIQDKEYFKSHWDNSNQTKILQSPNSQNNSQNIKIFEEIENNKIIDIFDHDENINRDVTENYKDGNNDNITTLNNLVIHPLITTLTEPYQESKNNNNLDNQQNYYKSFQIHQKIKQGDNIILSSSTNINSPIFTPLSPTTEYRDSHFQNNSRNFFKPDSPSNINKITDKSSGYDYFDIYTNNTINNNNHSISIESNNYNLPVIPPYTKIEDENFSLNPCPGISKVRYWAMCFIGSERSVEPCEEKQIIDTRRVFYKQSIITRVIPNRDPEHFGVVHHPQCIGFTNNNDQPCNRCTQYINNRQLARVISKRATRLQEMWDRVIAGEYILSGRKIPQSIIMAYNHRIDHWTRCNDPLEAITRALAGCRQRDYTPFFWKIRENILHNARQIKLRR